jgi:hypothetical protein
MTKEEILYPKIRTSRGVREAMFNSDGLMINHDVLEAMEEYAQSVSAEKDRRIKELEKENKRLKQIMADYSSGGAADGDL